VNQTQMAVSSWPDPPPSRLRIVSSSTERPTPTGTGRAPLAVPMGGLRTVKRQVGKLDAFSVVLVRVGTSAPCPEYLLTNLNRRVVMVDAGRGPTPDEPAAGR